MFNAFRMLVFLLAAALALGVSGCGKAQEKITEKAMEQAMAKDGGKAHVDLAKKQVSIQTKDGTKIDVANGGQSLQVPADFPKDIYIYDKAGVKGSVQDDDGRTLNLTTPDPVEKITAQYKAKMTAAGWTEKSNAAMTGMTMLEYEKAGQDVMVHITRSGDATQIILMVHKADN